MPQDMIEKKIEKLENAIKTLKNQSDIIGPEIKDIEKEIATLKNKHSTYKARAKHKASKKLRLDVLLQPHHVKFTNTLMDASALNRSSLIRHMIDYAGTNPEDFVSYLNRHLGREQKINIQLDMELSQ